MLKYNEIEVAKPVIEYLKSSGWDVYQEVPCLGSRADIVAVCGNIIKVVEVKTSLCMAVVGQAIRWLHYANYVYVAVPIKGGNEIAKRALFSFLKYLGIGVYEVDMRWLDRTDSPISERLAAKLVRRIPTEFREVLKKCPKEFAQAGSNGKYWTPFKETIESIKYYLKKHPYTDMKTIVKNVDHHYYRDSTAKACIVKYISKGVIEGIGRVGRGKCIKYYLKED